MYVIKHGGFFRENSHNINEAILDYFNYFIEIFPYKTLDQPKLVSVSTKLKM